MLNEDQVWFLVTIPDVIGVLSTRFLGREQRAFAQAHRDQFALLRLTDRLHLSLEVHGVAQQAFLTGREILKTRITRIHATVEHCHGPLQQVECRGVTQTDAVQRVFDVHTLVIDRDFSAFDGLIDNR